MKNVNAIKGKHLSRQTSIKGAGVCLTLPFLDAMTPSFSNETKKAKAKSFVALTLSLGLHGPNFNPKTSGENYTPSKYLRPFNDIKENFTVVTGSSHPGVTGGHNAEAQILSACPNQGRSMTKNTVSLDQLMAKHLGKQTRFPSLVLNIGGGSSPSYTEKGVMIPALRDPVKLFYKLFVDDSKEEQKRQMQMIHNGNHIMDVISKDAKLLQKKLGAGDRDKLDQWFTSVHELEKRLKAKSDWVFKPKPKVNSEKPLNYDRNNLNSYQKEMLDIMALALKTGSTRFISCHLSMNQDTGVNGVTDGFHNLSHHGQDSDKIKQLSLVEQCVLDNWANFIRNLKSHSTGNKSLLDETMVLLTSNLGNGSSHGVSNMPVLFAGGGFKHGRHLSFDQNNNYPLPKLYVNALQQLGLPIDQFSTTQGTMTGFI